MSSFGVPGLVQLVQALCEERRGFAQKILLFGDSCQFAPGPGNLLVTQAPCTRTGCFPCHLRLPLSAIQQAVADSLLMGHVHSADTALTGLFFCTTLELGTEFATFWYELPSRPLSAFLAIAVKLGGGVNAITAGKVLILVDVELEPLL